MRPATTILLSLLLWGCIPAPAPKQVRPRDNQMFSMQIQARLAYECGLLGRAEILYRRALTAAEATGDAQQIADLAYNLAVCKIELGEYHEADGLLTEAQMNLTMIKAEGTDVLVVQAKLARLMGQPEKAESLVAKVLATTGGKGSYALAAKITRAEVACDQQNVKLAEERLTAVEKLAGSTPENSIGSDLARLRGRIALLHGQPRRAAEEFAAEATLACSADHYRNMAQAWGRAGYAYLEANEPHSAAEYLYRSARTLWAQGFGAEAQPLARTAWECAQQSEAKELLLPIQNLLGRMNPTTSPASQGRE